MGEYDNMSFADVFYTIFPEKNKLIHYSERQILELKNKLYYMYVNLAGFDHDTETYALRTNNYIMLFFNGTFSIYALNTDCTDVTMMELKNEYNDEYIAFCDFKIVKNNMGYYISNLGAWPLVAKEDLNMFMILLEEVGVLPKYEYADDCEYVVYRKLDGKISTKLVYRKDDIIYFDGINIAFFGPGYAKVNDVFFIESPGYYFINNDIVGGFNKFIKRNLDCIEKVDNFNIYYDNGFAIKNNESELTVWPVSCKISYFKKFMLLKKNLKISEDFRYFIEPTCESGKNFYQINENKNIINRYIKNYLLPA